MEKLKLNLGSGDAEIKGWINLDIRKGNDIRKLPYENNSIEEVRASHVLEHFGHQEILPVLAEWVRVLHPGGRLRIAVPDFHYVAEKYLEGPTKEPLQGYIMGGQCHEHDFHRCIFDEQSLRAVMTEAGLIDITKWENNGEVQDCASLPVSLNLQGNKSANMLSKEAGGKILPGIMAIMSIPRVGFVDNMIASLRALPLLGIPLTKSSGVFWGQCMENMIESCLASGQKYVLAIDYDTLYTKDDVIELYDLIEAHPEVDALCAVQMKREGNTALFTMCNKSGEPIEKITVEEFRKPMFEVNSGHFGLTIIRCDSIKKMKKPWFIHRPDKDNTWGEGRIDEDCSFWVNLKESGGHLYQANKVMIGHMEQVISWPGKNLTPVLQRISEFEKTGRPKGELLCDLFS